MKNLFILCFCSLLFFSEVASAFGQKNEPLAIVGRIVGLPKEAIDFFELNTPINRQRFYLEVEDPGDRDSTRLILIENHYSSEKEQLDMPKLAKKKSLRFEVLKQVPCNQRLVDENGKSNVRWFTRPTSVLPSAVTECYQLAQSSKQR